MTKKLLVVLDIPFEVVMINRFVSAFELLALPDTQSGYKVLSTPIPNPKLFILTIGTPPTSNLCEQALGTEYHNVLLSIPNENGWDDDVPFQQIILPPIPPEVPKLGGQLEPN